MKKCYIYITLFLTLNNAELRPRSTYAVSLALSSPPPSLSLPSASNRNKIHLSPMYLNLIRINTDSTNEPFAYDVNDRVHVHRSIAVPTTRGAARTTVRRCCPSRGGTQHETQRDTETVAQSAHEPDLPHLPSPPHLSQRISEMINTTYLELSCLAGSTRC